MKTDRGEREIKIINIKILNKYMTNIRKRVGERERDYRKLFSSTKTVHLAITKCERNFINIKYMR